MFCKIKHHTKSIMRNLIKKIYVHRKMIYSLVLSDFKKRFVGSYFGIAWMFAQPITTILIYFLVFEVGFQNTPPVDAPYILWLVPGIIPWFYINEAINSGTNCLSEYSYLVKKMVFNVELLPVIKVISCLLVHTVFLCITLIVFLLYRRKPTLCWFQILYYAFAATMFSLTITYLTASINVFFKDMVQIVGIVLQFGMWLTPIMWAPQMFPNHPEWLEQVLKINPAYYIVNGYRDSLLLDIFFWQKPLNTIYFWGVTIFLFIINLRLFLKMRPHFADVL